MILKNNLLQVSLGLSLALGVACTSSDKVKEIDTKLDVKSRYEGKEVGVNEDDVAIVQERSEANDELRALEWGNARLLEKVETDYNELKRCREDLADPRLGGTGEVRDIPEIDDMKTLPEVKEEFGIDEKGRLAVIKRTKFKDALDQEKRFQTTLNSMQKTIAKFRTDCDRRMRTARVKAGLPATRYTAKGYYQNDGTWVETSKAEQNLDDAFDIKERNTKRSE